MPRVDLGDGFPEPVGQLKTFTHDIDYGKSYVVGGHIPNTGIRYIINI